MDATSLITLASDACAKLAELKEELDRVLNLTNKSLKSGIELKNLVQKGFHVTARKQVEQLVEYLERLAASEAAVTRLSATTLEPQIHLAYEPLPHPIHTPKLMPAYLVDVFTTTRPPSETGYMYEATVDRLACAFFTIFLPLTHQFLLQPQHTFRALAPDDVLALEAEWSIVGAVGDSSSRASAFNFADASDDLEELFIPLRASTPHAATDQRLRGEQYVCGEQSSSFEVSPPEAVQREGQACPEKDNATPLVSTPRAENASTLPGSARFDQLNRVVLLAKEGLQRPDLSIMFQNVKGAPGAPETTIVMCENKLRNGRAAIRQLKRYAERYGRDTPRMRFFAFKLGNRGLEVAMFRFAEATRDLAPIIDAENPNNGWYSVCAPFVYATMCELAAEVQSELWGFQWAYEATSATGRVSEEPSEDRLTT